ncbi:hypothetical protein [Streptomyces boncukensis]|uniref:Lipoprotein n=1 Tax=Streptomyces boncukensis TaxID=2711219 RepID=A0A6G4WRK2_9ACTN|nr:hypothetical protein [Streptomyces boncukensis]NGO67728.1 hypothetical protein [Streptomyces boncukensis]
MVRCVAAGALLLAAAAAAGCGSGADSRPERDPAVAWADGVCGHLGERGREVRVPRIDNRKPEAAQRRITAFLGDLSRELGTLERNMKREGPPPVKGVRDSFDRAMNKLGTAQRSLDQAAAKLRKAPVTDGKSLTEALRDAGRAVRATGAYQGPAQELRAEPKLRRAFDQAPGCDRLPPAGSPSPGTPSAGKG